MHFPRQTDRRTDKDTILPRRHIPEPHPRPRHWREKTGLGRPFPVGPPTPTSEHRGSSGGDGAARLEPGAGTLATRDGPDRPRPASSAWFLSWPSRLKPSRSRVSWVLGPRLQKLLCKTAVSGPSRLPDDGRPARPGRRPAGSRQSAAPSAWLAGAPTPPGPRLRPAPWGRCGPRGGELLTHRPASWPGAWRLFGTPSGEVRARGAHGQGFQRGVLPPEHPKS